MTCLGSILEQLHIMVAAINVNFLMAWGKTWVLIREGSRRCAVWLESVSGINQWCLQILSVCVVYQSIWLRFTIHWSGVLLTQKSEVILSSYYVFYLYEIWDSNSSDWKEYWLLGCYAPCNVEEISRPFKEELYCSTTKMAAIGSVKMVVNFHQTVQHHIQEPFFFRFHVAYAAITFSSSQSTLIVWLLVIVYFYYSYIIVYYFCKIIVHCRVV
jgi:hypothetical protein